MTDLLMPDLPETDVPDQVRRSAQALADAVLHTPGQHTVAIIDAPGGHQVRVISFYGAALAAPDTNAEDPGAIAAVSAALDMARIPARVQALDRPGPGPAVETTLKTAAAAEALARLLIDQMPPEKSAARALTAACRRHQLDWPELITGRGNQVEQLALSPDDVDRLRRWFGKGEPGPGTKSSLDGYASALARLLEAQIDGTVRVDAYPARPSFLACDSCTRDMLVVRPLTVLQARRLTHLLEEHQ
ncbi:hypothetical protein [Streptomyces sp. NPDC088775]|uniref:hypothetical protein n=1 Tax=Streptomyces sp. NPDC088775 TaxID=3365896 RepID=UPI00382CCA8A